jgi:hypothetical protein
MNTGLTDPGWYYSKLGGPPGQRFGPLTWEDLVSHARSGHLSADDLVWQEQFPDWRPASQVPGLLSSSPPPLPPPLPAQAAAPAPAATKPHRSRYLAWLIPLIVVVLVGAGLGVYFGFFSNRDITDALSHDVAEAFVQQEGEILLEPSGAAGPESFSGEQFVVPGPTTTLSIPNPQVTLPPLNTTTVPASTTSQATSTSQPASTTTATALPTVLVAYPGDTPALYGGSKSKLIADKEKELAFLQQNPNKALAFCEALNSDPTLRWSGGSTVSPAQLPAYFAELTPLLLTRDTRVTNYGYRNGRPTPRQSVLQAGQLVLVDRYGVPRKRCECGNPLTPPIPTSKPPVYTGPRWPSFNPTTIIVVQQTTVIINNFTVIDIHTGETFGRPPGTSGPSDGPTTGMTWGSPSSSTTASMGMNWGTGEIPSNLTVPTSSPASTTPTLPPSSETTQGTGITGSTTPGSTTPGSTTQVTTPGSQLTVWKLEVMMRRSDASSKREMSVEWGVETTVDPGGSLSGSGPGSWHVDGTVWEGQTETGTFSADATFTVEVAGNVEAEADGRTLHIQQKMTGYQVQNLTMNTTSDQAKTQAAIEAAVPGWLNAAFTNLLLPGDSGPLYGYAVSGGYEGSANLLPVR